MEGFQNLAVVAVSVTTLNDLNLNVGQPSTDAPFTFAFTGLKGIHKVIIYAKTADDSVAGWEVSYFILCFTSLWTDFCKTILKQQEKKPKFMQVEINLRRLYTLNNSFTSIRIISICLL